MTMYTVSPISPKSSTGQMNGCTSFAAASASRRKRSVISLSRARCACSTFTMTSRASGICSARNTVAMPPPPSRFRMRYRVPVARRSAVISSSGFSVGGPATWGSTDEQRLHDAAIARFHVPQSGQNTSAPQLHLNEIIGRPGAGELEPKVRIALSLLLHLGRELLPQLLLDQKRGAQHDAG